jgi:hypothetical protein
MSPNDACEPLAKSVGGTGCKEDKPGGLAAAATSNYVFDLADPRGRTCQILGFKSENDLDATVKAFDAAAALAGPHRYPNKKRLLFVQCNSDMPAADGKKIEAALAGL